MDASRMIIFSSLLLVYYKLQHRVTTGWKPHKCFSPGYMILVHIDVTHQFTHNGEQTRMHYFEVTSSLVIKVAAEAHIKENRQEIDCTLGNHLKLEVLNREPSKHLWEQVPVLGNICHNLLQEKDLIIVEYTSN
ncbi:hypothetical protein ACJX0J_030409 [Zea mays]